MNTHTSDRRTHSAGHEARFGFDETHQLFREGFRTFLKRTVVPHYEKWETAGIVDKELFRAAGASGFLGFEAPERYGGGAVHDFRYNAIISEEAAAAGVAPAVSGIALQNNICLPYFLDVATEQQQARWLPGICAGTLVVAIAMTEPSAGSDLAAIRTTARREGDTT